MLALNVRVRDLFSGLGPLGDVRGRLSVLEVGVEDEELGHLRSLVH